MHRNKRIAIVGSGLAGICLHRFLSLKSCEVDVYDAAKPASTQVAVGLFNPLVFRRVNKSWMVDQLLPFINAFYHRLEVELKLRLIHPHKLWKIQSSSDYHQMWNKRAATPEFRNYIAPFENDRAEVFQAGRVDTKALMNAYIDHLKSNEAYIQMEVKHEELLKTKDGWRLGNRLYDSIIFSEGAHGALNPLFSWLPWNICKGEWIEVRTNRHLTNDVLNKVVNIMPSGSNFYKIASTYDWQSLDWHPSQKATDQLLSAFKEVFDVDAALVDARAGLRPAVADRRPYLGWHPEKEGIGIFNGLGSKGVMLAPYFANHFSDNIAHGAPLMPEVDITRHLKRFTNSD